MADHAAQRVDVITPEGPAFEGEAEIVVVPGTAGQLGIMAHHAPLVSSLKPGELHVTDMEGRRHQFATDGGFVEVRRNETLVGRARRVQRFLSQPFNVAEAFTGRSGKYVKLPDTIRGFKEIVDGKHDDVPEQAFYMQGTIEDVVASAKKLAG